MTNPVALIIEDDESLATVFSMALQMAGFQTEIARTGKAALTSIAELTPTLIMLDLHLPHVAGQDILRQIRSEERLARTWVILATADAITAEGLRGEADLVLLKPISVTQLRDLAKRLFPA
jgi:two-component system response regulator RegX3